MTRLTRDQMLMQIAHTVAARGTCDRARVGAILAIDSRVISTGYNGVPTGFPHCAHRLEMKGSNGCQVAVHAEANAIVFAAREGISTKGSTLYVTMSPCVACARLVINAGVVRVLYRVPYRDPSGVELLQAAGIITEEVSL